MARSDLLLSLVRSGAAGNQKLLRSTVEALIAEERAKQHHILAERLGEALSSGEGRNGSVAHKEPEVFSRIKDYFVEKQPERTLESLMLKKEAHKLVAELVEEQRRADLLRSYGLEPRHKAILVGPPGNGKTSLAEAVAEALALPFYVVRYDAIIGSYLGETAARLRKVFDFLKTFACVVFFDEFDVVGKERGDEFETGEIKRVVSSLLMQIDDLPSYTIVFSATNHPELLDRAVWRRFDLRIGLPAPTQTEVRKYLSYLSDRDQFQLAVSPTSITKKLGKISYSEMEQFYLNLRRRTVLGDNKKLSEADIGRCIREFVAMKQASSISC